MTRRTPLQMHRLEAYAEREMLRELAQSVPCEECEAPAGQPCVYVDGQHKGLPMGRIDHPLRLRKAERARADE